MSRRIPLPRPLDPSRFLTYLAVCRVNSVRVSPSQRRHLARRKRASRTGSCGEHFDAAKGVEGPERRHKYLRDGPLGRRRGDQWPWTP
jgi:hypothetical protein